MIHRLLAACAVWVTGLAAVFGQAESPQVVLPEHVESQLDVVYARYGDRELRLDLFVPRRDPAAKPALLIVHGGGWLKGDKTRLRPLAQALASRGYVTAAMEYRLGGEAKFPAAIQDCHAAVRWLRSQADVYAIDAGRIGAVGGSAGGHLVGLLAATADVAPLRGAAGQGSVSSAIQAAVVLAGPLDLSQGSVAERSRRDAEANVNQWLGKTVDQAPELYRLASATTHFNASTPPILFMTGEHDQPELNRDARQQLQSLGIRTGLRVYKDGEHGCWNREPWFWPMVEDMDLFFRQVFALPPSTEWTLLSKESWGTLERNDQAVALCVERMSADGVIEMPKLQNPFASVRLVGSEMPLTVRPGTQRWTVVLPPGQPVSLPARIVIETMGPPRLSRLPAVVSRGDNEAIVLAAHEAVTQGEQLRYEPQPHKNTVGYWTNEKDTCQWHFYLERPGTFRVHVLQGCGQGHGGSLVSVNIGAQQLTFTVQDTGHFQKFEERTVGLCQLKEPGLYTLELRPLSKTSLAVMDVRRVQLVPVASHSPDDGIFALDNLVAWCIVPFDAKKRGPEARAEMLTRLGIRRVAYDWRAEHVPTFEEEILQYQRHGLEYFAFWSWHPDMEPLIRQHGIRPQLWLTNPSPRDEAQGDKVRSAAEQLWPEIDKARALGCQAGLYNHGGWGGEPENLVAVCEYLRSVRGANHVGIVYNFHHGHEHIPRFAQHVASMLPYLLCVNINGMVAADQVDGLRNKIVPLGQGQYEQAMLEIVRDSGYRGPIGILNHRDELDAEEGLRANLEGLQQLRVLMRK